MAKGAILIILATFLAAAVEWVEALTIVLVSERRSDPFSTTPGMAVRRNSDSSGPEMVRS
jgi:hypothetical protein